MLFIDGEISIALLFFSKQTDFKNNQSFPLTDHSGRLRFSYHRYLPKDWRLLYREMTIKTIETISILHRPRLLYSFRLLTFVNDYFC